MFLFFVLRIFAAFPFKTKNKIIGNNWQVAESDFMQPQRTLEQKTSYFLKVVCFCKFSSFGLFLVIVFLKSVQQKECRTKKDPILFLNYC